MILKKISAFVFIFLLCVNTSCTKKNVQTNKDQIVVALETEPPTLDWNLTSNTTSAELLDNLIDGLTDFDIHSPDLKAVPKLAEKWDVSKDGLVYTFYLRKDVKWHDGVPLVAQHFYDSWVRLLDPNEPASSSFLLFDVKNAQAYYQRKKPVGDLGLKVIDNHTFQVTLERPAAFFAYVPTHHGLAPIRMDLVKKYGRLWTEAGNFVGIGPYKLKAWVHEEYLTLERFDEYYGPKAKVKTILARITEELSSALTLFETNQIDLIFPKLPSRELNRLRRDFSTEYKEDGLLASYYIGFNCRKKPFDNPKVRKALSMAIDRTEITKIKNGGEIPFSSWIPKGMMGYDPMQGVKFDPVAAKQLLKEAGYETPDKFPVVKLAYNTSEDHQPVFENVQAQLARNLGITVRLDNMDWKSYLAKLENLKSLKSHDSSSDSLSAFRMGWVGDYPDPDNFMKIFTKESTQNFGGWVNDEYDKLIEDAVKERNPDKRRMLYHRAQEILTEIDIPIMPLYVYTQQMLVKSHIKGYKLNAMQKLFFDELYVD